MLFKTFGGLDSIPIVLDTKDPDEIVETLVRLRPTFGAVNLEDISAPRCFEIERRVIEALDCPVMHDDQHGTAIVIGAAILNGLHLLGKDLKQVYVDTRAKLDPVYGSFPIYEHCMPFDVSRAYDEAKGIKNPRIWTAERDKEMWAALQA